MQKSDIYVIVVIYNKNYADSITLNCLKGIEGIRVIVCDNSTRDYNNSWIPDELKYRYISMNGNKGLSVAYNKAIDYINDDSGVICLFDDDTKVGKEYFDAVMKEMDNDIYDILLPKVYDEVGLMSPCIMKKHFLHRANSVEELNLAEISGINSGMAIRLKVFNEYRYDENIFLDFIDHAFIRDMISRNKRIKIVDTELHQRFSANVKNKPAEKIRFKILKRDLKYFYRISFFGRLYYYYVILKRKTRLSIKYHDFKVLLW